MISIAASENFDPNHVIYKLVDHGDVENQTEMATNNDRIHYMEVLRSIASINGLLHVDRET